MLTIPSEIRNLLKSDSVNKNFRVHFPNGERADITNDNIVDESITFGESICSSEQLQFGLCETPTLEFETVGVENIKGAVIECSMEVECGAKSHTWFHKFYSNDSIQTPSNYIYISMQDVLGIEFVPAGVEVHIACDEVVSSIEIECSEDGILWENNEIASNTDDCTYTATTEASENYVKGFYVYVYGPFHDEGGVNFNIRNYPIIGTIYREDIGKYVYPIPYGTFIVDSCKKQSDMSHRRITTYNTFAYKNWEFNSFIKNIMQMPFYWYEKDLKVSIEGLTKLLFPDSDASYITIDPDQPQPGIVVKATFRTKYTSIFEEGGARYSYKILVTYVTYNQYFDSRSDWKDANILNYKVKLNNTYCEYAKNIISNFNSLAEEHNLNILEQENNWYLRPKKIVYEHYSSGTNDYYLENPDESEYFFRFSTFDETYVPLLHKTLCTPHKISTMEQSVSFWESCVRPGIVAPVRMQLTKYNLNTAQDEVLMDTGEYTPEVFLDVNSKNYNLFNSPSGFYFPLKYAKKTVRMDKYVYSSGSESTVSKTLYLYDWSNLVGMDNKEIIQSYLELQGKFGLIKRDGNIDFISVNEAFNTPDDTIPKSEYETIWYDDYMSKPYGRISATYTNENNESTYTYLDIVEDFSEEKYKTYDISNNFFIKNYSRTEEDIQLIFTAMSLNMKDISFMPMQITMKGRPDLEAGDVILIESDDQEEPIVGFMMQRRLTGVGSLKDEISSQDEISSETVSSLKATYDEDTGTLTLYTADTRR